MDKIKAGTIQVLKVLLYLSLPALIILVIIDHEHLVKITLVTLIIHVIYIQYKLYGVIKNELQMMINQVELTNWMRTMTGGRNIRRQLKKEVNGKTKH